MGVFDDIKEILENILVEATKKYNSSKRWKEYRLGATLTHCEICFERNNKIYDLVDIMPI